MMSEMVKLDAHGEMLLQQYRELRPTLQKLSDEAYDLLSHALCEQGIYITAMEHRVKTEKSLTGKLELKGAKYKSIDDITDLVGLRVITFYTDEVDKVAAIAKRVFDIELLPNVCSTSTGRRASISASCTSWTPSATTPCTISAGSKPVDRALSCRCAQPCNTYGQRSNMILATKAM